MLHIIVAYFKVFWHNPKQTIKFINGTKFWYLNGKRHRVDGPAIEWASGDKCWYINGKRHRVDGPAVEWTDGSKFWFLNDKRHRLDGPAIEWPDGSKFWYINGKQYDSNNRIFRILSNSNCFHSKIMKKFSILLWYEEFKISLNSNWFRL